MRGRAGDYLLNLGCDLYIKIKNPLFILDTKIYSLVCVTCIYIFRHKLSSVLPSSFGINSYAPEEYTYHLTFAFTLSPVHFLTGCCNPVNAFNFLRHYHHYCLHNCYCIIVLHSIYIVVVIL